MILEFVMPFYNILYSQTREIYGDAYSVPMVNMHKFYSSFLLLSCEPYLHKDNMLI
jgi:hypothetical protein